MGRTSRKRCQKKKLNIKELTKQEENLMHLKSWLLVNNCLSVSDLFPFNFPVTGRGLKTLRDIKINDVLIKIPYEILITTATISQSNICIMFSETECYSPHCILSVFLIYESHLGNNSKWYHYINCLPQVLTNPDFCTQKEKNLLPAFILDYVHKFHNIQNDFWLLIRSMRNLSLNKKGNCSHCNEHLRKIITFERYKWAYYIVNTRAVYMDTNQIEINQDVTINIKHPNNLALAPFLDLFNHDVHTSVNVSMVTNKDYNKFYEITTLKSFHKESQVFINYGAYNNLQLYIHYGFFISNNPLDEVYFDISDIQACVSIPKFKLDFIFFNNLQNNMAFTRENLNYNAISTLFVVTTKLQKEHWSAKIYGDSLTSEDVFNVYNVAKKILNLKRNELTNYLTNMKNIKHYTQCFLIAISLVEEYIAILTESDNKICRNH